jgi:hypothetical protein
MNAARHQASQVRHLPGIKQWLDHLPISRVPSNKQHTIHLENDKNSLGKLTGKVANCDDKTQN